MVWLKSCRRCGGDLYMETDQFGSYVSCFQCGAAVANFDENTPDDDISETVDAVVAQAQSA
ncbi:MAG: hypothetical protein J4O08_06800 [Chloroflexi bacterium]|nr:hypothetical protein [Chloroflexota bacterium]MCH8869695.1 hypothetical protein [Chloroflexota bacterium]MCH9039590.1 hypothetical protein [Chloroflexota bacterium]MCI0791179.1 hypothetical protein [Chloroflexota bacterium]MCI0796354.1 hypothetical protein [Chloroflexota bacterium]